MKALTTSQAAMYSHLQTIAASDHPSIVVGGVAELSVARALQRRGLAIVNGRTVTPTPEAIEFRRGITAQRTATAQAVAA